MRSRGSLVALWLLLPASCGGDDSESTTGFETSASGSSSSTTGDATSASATDGGSGSTGTDASTTGDGTGTGSAGTTTGDPGADGTYPPPDGSGQCPTNTAAIQVPAGALCGPFCEGADGVCPAAETGTATAECVPFAQDGGSDTACADHDECPTDEACSSAGMCVSVAFWGCRLLCDMGETCPEAMTCGGGAQCGYGA